MIPQCFVNVFLHGFLDKLAEDGTQLEFALGIPEPKISAIPTIHKPVVWRYVLQRHPAQKAGDHYDIRLVDPDSGHAHSWATKKEIPGPGERPIKAFQQPTHTAEYVDYEGPIVSGYGKTRDGEAVARVSDQPVEILKTNNNLVRFNIYEGSEPQELVMTRDKKQPKSWYVINTTKTRQTLPDVPFSRPDYKDTDFKRVDVSDDSQIMSAKIDGGHSIFVLDGGSHPRAFSYRTPKKGRSGVIERTHKIESLYSADVPKSLTNTILRGEVYARDLSGEAPVPAEIVTGMLNANVWKSRDLQKQRGKLRAAIFDVVKHKGKDMSDAPYTDKVGILREVVRAMPEFEIPELANTKKEKEELLNAIKTKSHPQTQEGVVLWHKDKALTPVKAKIKKDYDVYVRKIEQARDTHGNPKNEAGAFWFSLTPDGPLVGKVGTGFTRKLRQDMWERPGVYINAVARAMAQTQYSTGALGKPVFMGWHADKSPDLWSNDPIER